MIEIKNLSEANDLTLKDIIIRFVQYLYFKFEKHPKADIFKCNFNKSKLSKVKSFIKDLGFEEHLFDKSKLLSL